MKTYKSSALTRDRASVLESARTGGALLEFLETNGKVIKGRELVIITKAEYDRLAKPVNKIER